MLVNSSQIWSNLINWVKCVKNSYYLVWVVTIFSDMVEKTIEIFMDDFSVLGNSFDNYLENLRAVLARCEETNLVLNWEKCHFMVQEGVVLGHRISTRGIEVDRDPILV